MREIDSRVALAGFDEPAHLLPDLGACLSHARRHEGDPGEAVRPGRFAAIVSRAWRGQFKTKNRRRKDRKKMPPGAAAIGATQTGCQVISSGALSGMELSREMEIFKM